MFVPCLAGIAFWNYIMIKGLIQQEVTIANVYATNAMTASCLKQILMHLKAYINPIQ